MTDPKHLAQLTALAERLEAENAALRDAIAKISGGGAYLPGFTPQESRLLRILHRHNGHPKTAGALCDILYADDPGDARGDKIIDVFLTKIRRKIGRDAIVNVWGHGWRLSDEGYARVSAIIAEADGGVISSQGEATDAAHAAEASATARPQRVAGASAHRDQSEEFPPK